MSTSNRIIKPGYESYQPVIAARQFGLRHHQPTPSPVADAIVCSLILTSQSLSIYHLPFWPLASRIGGQCGRLTSFEKPWGQCCSRLTLSMKSLRKRYHHQFSTSSWFCLTPSVILFIFSTAGGWPGAQERWWLHFQVLTGCSRSPLWQECTSPVEGHNADPAWFYKISLQAKTSLRCCCLPSPD
jgi:hypothetical protein